MKPGTEEYFDLVCKELQYIKQNATQEEIAKLDFKTLDPDNVNFCIYGQMTGYCYGNRATELIHSLGLKMSFRLVDDKSDLRFVSPRFEDEKYYSHTFVEHCIHIFPQYNKSFIDYLQGRADETIFLQFVQFDYKK